MPELPSLPDAAPVAVPEAKPQAATGEQKSETPACPACPSHTAEPTVTLPTVPVPVGGKEEPKPNTPPVEAAEPKAEKPASTWGVQVPKLPSLPILEPKEETPAAAKPPEKEIVPPAAAPVVPAPPQDPPPPMEASKPAPAQPSIPVQPERRIPVLWTSGPAPATEAPAPPPAPMPPAPKPAIKPEPTAPPQALEMIKLPPAANCEDESRVKPTIQPETMRLTPEESLPKPPPAQRPAEPMKVPDPPVPAKPAEMAPVSKTTLAPEQPKPPAFVAPAPRPPAVLDEPVPPTPAFSSAPMGIKQTLYQQSSDSRQPGEENLGYQIQLETPGPQRVFRLESEGSFQERMRQEARERPVPERITFPEEPILTRERYAGRHWAPLHEIVEPVYTCHGRLLFEQPNSERFGWDLGIVQPLVSVGAFYWDVATLPYNVFKDPCRHFDCSAGKCLPGDPMPFLLYPPEWSITGSLAEAATITGLIFVFP
jgi:hypothetical protein